MQAERYVPSNIFTFAPPAQSAEEKGVSERIIILTSIFPSKSSLSGRHRVNNGVFSFNEQKRIARRVDFDGCEDFR